MYTPPSSAQCPNGSLPCLFNSNCFDFSEMCNGVNDCGDSLAYDELAGFRAGFCDPSGSECKFLLLKQSS